ncbi:MAG: DUF2851 family protein [Bacteroidales bacterium]|nr:DUF2851 family protein [Bacteroidales bacterium]
MTEQLLHLVWKYNPHRFNGLHTSNNELIEVIDAGMHNTNAGPDFFNAKIKIDGTTWVGNVEMHLKASDWYAHNHQTDKNYNNVILHVVVSNDRQAVTESGIAIPTLTIPYPAHIEKELEDITNSGSWIPCANQFSTINSLTVKSVIERMMVERLEQKTKSIAQAVHECQNGWEEAFYQAVARCFGLKVNALPAELMAKQTPLKVLAKHKNNLFQIEAILFGQAGLLERDEPSDEYKLSLQIEYSYLQKKFGLKPIDGSLWKFMRLRPAAFPTIRIAQLSKLIHTSSALFSKVVESATPHEIAHWLETSTSDYWETHYTFGNTSPVQIKQLGRQTIETIILNAVIPFVFAYGEHQHNTTLKEKSLNYLESLPPENNSVITKFRQIGADPTSAFDTQALLHLKANYCNERKCIFCPIGTSIVLKSSISL